MAKAMKYTDSLSKDRPPCKITNSAMNQYTAEVMDRFLTEKLHYLLTERFDLAPEAFFPQGMPHSAPKETNEYRHWRAWNKFTLNCFIRAQVATGIAARFFDQCGIKKPSREALLRVFNHELQFIKRNP